MDKLNPTSTFTTTQEVINMKKVKAEELEGKTLKRDKLIKLIQENELYIGSIKAKEDKVEVNYLYNSLDEKIPVEDEVEFEVIKSTKKLCHDIGLALLKNKTLNFEQKQPYFYIEMEKAFIEMDYERIAPIERLEEKIKTKLFIPPNYNPKEVAKLFRKYKKQIIIDDLKIINGVFEKIKIYTTAPIKKDLEKYFKEVEVIYKEVKITEEEILINTLIANLLELKDISYLKLIVNNGISLVIANDKAVIVYEMFTGNKDWIN